MALSPPNGDVDLIPVRLLPNQGRGYGFGLTRLGVAEPPEGYDRTVNMSVRNGRLLSPSFLMTAYVSHAVARIGFAAAWQSTDTPPQPFVIYGRDSSVVKIQDGAGASETDATAATYYSGCFHDNAGTALYYAGTDLATGFLNRRTQAGTWSEDADVTAKYIVSAAGALWRTTSDYQISKCAAGSDPFTAGNWGAAIQVGTSTAKILNIAAIGAAPVVFKEDGIWSYNEADARFENRYPVYIDPKHFSFVSPDGAGGLLTGTADGALITISQYGNIRADYPLAETFPSRDTPYGRIRDAVVDGENIYAIIEPFSKMVQPSGLKVLKTTDNFGTFTDYSANVIDQSWATTAVLSSLDTLANGDAVLVGFDDQFLAIEWLMAAAAAASVTVSAAISTGAGTWSNIAGWQDHTLSWQNDGIMSMPVGVAITSWVTATYNSLTKYWLRLTVSAALGASVTVAEVKILPLRAYPLFTSDDDGLAWEASGAEAKVIRGRRVGDGIRWDDVHTVNQPNLSRLLTAPLPTDNSPRSLVAIGLNGSYGWPLPVYDEPTMAAYPALATRSNAASLAFYPSAVDLGPDLYELAYVQCVGQDFVAETDEWAAAFRWDETNAWMILDSLKQSHALFSVRGQNQGSVLHTAFQLVDGAATEPVGPSGREIIAWVRPLQRTAAGLSQPTRTTPEVA